MNLHRSEKIHDFLHAFLPALTNAHQYTVAHQLARSSIENAFGLLVETMRTDLTLPIKIVEGRVIIDEEPLEDSIHINRFIQFMTGRGIEHLRFSRGVTAEEFTSFITMLTIVPMPPENERVFTHIQSGKVGLGFKHEDIDDQTESTENTAKYRGIEDTEDTEDNEIKAAEIMGHFKRIQEKESSLMGNMYDAVRKGSSLPEREIRDAVTDIVQTIKQGSAVLTAFSPLRALDEYTFTHSTNVCILTLAQAMALKIKEELLHDIGIAAMLHDVGKLFVPEEILNKPGRLTNREMDAIRLHPSKGAEYLADKAGLPRLSVIVAYEHHMQYDHSGYPAVSPSWRQNVCSQMCTIADFFDAMRTKRVYRDAVETKIITEQMSEMAGKQLNPVLTKNFLVLLKKLFDLQTEQS